MGIPPGKPIPEAMLSIRVVRDCFSVNVTSRPAPADSNPSGIEAAGDGWIVDLVCAGASEVWVCTAGMGASG